MANFVPKFVAVATGVNRETILMTPSDSAGPKIRGRCKQRAIFLIGPSYRLFCPKFRFHGNGDRSGVNMYNTVKLADPENHTLKPKITILFYT